MARSGVPLAILVTLGLVTAGLSAGKRDSGLVAHEWGTFTTVAGTEGEAVQWLPLGGPADLPCFVNHFQDSTIFKLAPGIAPVSSRGSAPSSTPVAAPLSYSQARTAVRGTVRMETPVIYFYAPRETTVAVAVGFPQGLMTEWYPKAAVSQPAALPAILAKRTNSLIQWNAVKVRPRIASTLPSEAAASHYYAARDTDAAPVQVMGQDEKFLFYRGVGGFQVPLSGVVAADGSIIVRTQADVRVPDVVLFENRGGRIGYRVHGELQGTVSLASPALTGDVASLKRELEGMLTATGLYAREAHAMVETWGDSWFEEGTRLFYIVPGASVDAILPLTITPAAERVVRTFVGRMELVTPAAMCAVRDAIAQGDEPTLKAYGRFLGPIADRLDATATPTERARTEAVLAAHYKSYVTQVASACK
jgi:hypothetical protein